VTHQVKVLSVNNVTHDTKRFVVEKPEGYSFVPGQATLVSINEEGWKKEDRPFTFTNLEKDRVLEFIIKGYPEHDGVTKRIHKLNMGSELLLGEPFGTIQYKGKGVFIAAGAGITPFIAILKKLYSEDDIYGNILIFSNKTSKDIICEKELRKIFKDTPENLILTLTREKKEGYEHGRIDEGFLRKRITIFSQNFYVCGPPKFLESIKTILQKLGINPQKIVFEE